MTLKIIKKNFIDFKKYIKSIFQPVFKKINIVLFNKLLPDIFSVQAGKFGYSRYIKKNHRIKFKASCYNTKYKIIAHGDRTIEKEAAARRTSPNDPINSLRFFNIKEWTCIDIGANVGTVSIFMVACGAKRVFSFEPGPLYKSLQRNIAINSLSNKIFAINKGLSNSAGKMFWAEDLNNKGNAHLLNSLDQLNITSISTNFGKNSDLLKEVEVDTLDDFIITNVIDKLDLIKIDVEGMEWQVIEGGLESFKKFKTLVLVETHRVASDMMRYDCITPIFKFFYSLGYKSYKLNSDSKLVKFIYPNFIQDTVFIPSEKINSLKDNLN